MSYDIIILKPVGSRTDNLADVGEVLDIGDEALVLRSLALVLPGCIQGVFVKDESFTIEGSLSASFKGFCQSYAIPSRLTHFR
jgi:hypothetical protein